MYELWNDDEGVQVRGLFGSVIRALEHARIKRIRCFTIYNHVTGDREFCADDCDNLGPRQMLTWEDFKREWERDTQ